MARWRGQHLPITDPVAMSKAANSWWCHGVCNRACGARPDRAASEESVDCGSAPESGSSHPRTAPGRDAAGSGTSRRYLAPCRPTADHWITETFRCDEDATRRPARCGSRWIDSSQFSLPTRDCSNALLLSDSSRRRSRNQVKLPELLDLACFLAFRRSGAARGSGPAQRLTNSLIEHPTSWIPLSSISIKPGGR